MSRFYYFPPGGEPADYGNVTLEELEGAVEVTDWTGDPEEVFTYSPGMNETERVFQDLQDVEDFTWDALVDLANLIGQGDDDAVD